MDEQQERDLGLYAVRGTAAQGSDRRVFLHFSRVDPEDIMLRQTWNGPAHLTIGGDTSEEDLQRAATRLDISVEELRAFRDAQRALFDARWKASRSRPPRRRKAIASRLARSGD